ncbi:hypothetical protein BH10ACI2_BH10ACI2_09740 [soil metagenome]
MEATRLTSDFWSRVVSWFRHKSTSGQKGIVYTFKAPLLGYTRSVTAVAKSELGWVAQFIPVAEFQELFGGYITWRPTDEIGETIGVWGKRNVSRFRRILLERGAEFDIVDNEGPIQKPWVVTTHGYTKNGRRMLPKT